MLHIAICDDTVKDLTLFKNATSSYFLERNEQVDITCFTNSSELLDKLETNNNFDIMILDICMPGMSGIDIAKEVRKTNNRSEIIFLTVSSEYAVQAFSLKASHYIVKPCTQAEFKEALDRAFSSFSKNAPIIMSLKLIGTGYYSVDINNIVFVESNNHEQIVYLKNGEQIHIRESIAIIYEKLERLAPNQFIIPYRGYIINLNSVQTIESTCIKLHGNKSIPIIRRNFKKIYDNYFNYTFNQKK